MKKLSFIFVAALVFAWGATFAQCTINTNNTNIGITPSNSSNTLTQGVAYSQTLQVYAPATYSAFTVDSIHVATVTGQPNNLIVTFNPIDNGGITVKGGGNGAICFNGATASPVGSYPLSFTGSIFVNGSTVGQPLALLSAYLKDTFFVVAAPPPPSCDTLINVSLTGGDTAYYAPWSSPNVGYVDGTGALSGGGQTTAQLAIAEKFTTTVGYHVNTAVIFPVIATVNPTDTNLPVTIYVYDNSGVALQGVGPLGAPGVAIDSAVVTLGQIAQAATNAGTGAGELGVNFPHQPALTSNAYFIVLSLPQVTGDTIVLFTNSGDNHHGNGWLEIGLGWLAYDSLLVGDVNQGLYIASIACPTVSLPPTASFTSTPASACVGGTVSFTDNSLPAPTNYAWDFGDGSTPVQGSGTTTHVYGAAGVYNVLHLAANLNGQTEVVNTVTVTAAATLATAVVAAVGTGNGSATVTATGTSPFTYLWSGDGSTSDSINAAAGTYTVTVTDGNNCTSTSSATISMANGIVALNNASTVTVYPNPASTVLNLTWSQKSNADVSVVDMNGNVIKTFTTAGDSKSVLDIQNLATGNYILRFTDKTNNVQQSTMFSKF